MTIETNPTTIATLDARFDALIADMFTPIPKMKGSEWCDQFLFIPAGNAKPGPWETDYAPYQREWIDTATDPATRKMVLMTSAQVGKTAILVATMAYHMAYEPRSMLYVSSKDQAARDFNNEKFEPTIDATPVLRAVVKPRETKNSGNAILRKRFKGGCFVKLVGAQKADNLQASSVPLVLADEVDKWPASAGKSGDPLKLAAKRLESFGELGRMVIASTPLDAGTSVIEREYLTSDQRKFFVPCPHCGLMQTLKWGGPDAAFGVKWDAKNPTDVWYVCESDQACVIRETEKYRMMLRGEWRAQNPSSTIPGFHINALYSTWCGWAQIVIDFIATKESRLSLKQWVNEYLGETFNPAARPIKNEELLLLCAPYERGTIPSGAQFIMASADVQGNRIEVAYWAANVDEQMWLVDHDIYEGDTGKEYVWQHFALGIDSAEFPRVDTGELVKPTLLVLDSSYVSEMVYRFVTAQAKVRTFAIKGAEEKGKPLWGKERLSGDGKNVYREIGTDTAKDILFARLIPPNEGERQYIHFYRGVDPETLAQVNSEHAVINYKRGKKEYEWKKKTPNSRNEQLDMMVYAYAGLQQYDKKKIAEYWAARTAGQPLPQAAKPQGIKRINIRYPKPRLGFGL